MDLENRNAALQEELSLAPAKRAALQTDWVPRAPASYTLTGHRGEITKVAFHPTFNLLASASQDATVKIWDWETGEFERTLKGHTRHVTDLDFDSKGKLLGTSTPPAAVCAEHICTNWALFASQLHAHPIYSSRYGTSRTNGRTRRRFRDTSIPCQPYALCLEISKWLVPVATALSGYST